MANEFNEMLADALRDPMKYGISGCALCGERHLAATALYVPADAVAKRLGQPKGKKRLIVYFLCQSCSEIPDKADRVEAEIPKRTGVQ